MEALDVSLEPIYQLTPEALTRGGFYLGDRAQNIWYRETTLGSMPGRSGIDAGQKTKIVLTEVKVPDQPHRPSVRSKFDGFPIVDFCDARTAHGMSVINDAVRGRSPFGALDRSRGTPPGLSIPWPDIAAAGFEDRVGGCVLETTLRSMPSLIYAVQSNFVERHSDIAFEDLIVRTEINSSQQIRLFVPETIFERPWIELQTAEGWAIFHEAAQGERPTERSCPTPRS